MILFLRIFVFIAFSMVELVPANELVSLPNQKDILQEPEDCILKSSICALQTSPTEKFKLKLGALSSLVILDRSTLIVRLDSKSIRLIKGQIWLQVKSPLEVQTEFGKVEAFEGDFWVLRSSSEVRVIASGGDLFIYKRGEINPMNLPKGFQTWFAGANSSGKSQNGLPAAIDIYEHLQRWARLFPGSRKEFNIEIKKWRPIWSQAINQSSEFHKKLLIERTVAMQDDERKKKEIHAREEALNKKLRALFKERTFE